MTKFKLSVVAPATTAPAAPSPKFKTPLLIEMTPAEQRKYIVVPPTRLISRNRLELLPVKKLLRGTIDGAGEVRFEFVVQA